MSFASLLSLPVEIQDAIVSRIPKAFDVLNFGLTCKSIFTIVASRHLSYRQIGPIDMTSCQGSEPWRDLIAHPDRTANVNSLDIKFKRISPEATTAINLMQSLSEVTLVDISDETSVPTREAQAAVWESLSRKACLKSLRVILLPGCNILFASGITKVHNTESTHVLIAYKKQSDFEPHKSRNIYLL